MEGIGLDNMLGAADIEKMFSNPAGEPSEAQEDTDVETSEVEEGKEETVEADFSDLLGNEPESVGSEKESEGTGGTSESGDDSGTPSDLFSSIAEALRDEGVFPDLSDDTIKGIKDAAGIKKLFDDEAAKQLSERQQRLEKALNSGATTNEMQTYQGILSDLDILNSKEAYETLSKEGEEGENFRKRLMYQDYVSRGMKHERAVKLIQKSLDDGTDIEDAKEAFNSYKEFCEGEVKRFQDDMDNREKSRKDQEAKQLESLKKHILDTENFYGGVQVDKSVRQKAYESVTKPVYKDEQGNYLTALQQYQREHPMEFMENVAMLYALTDNFKSVDKLVKKQVQKKTKGVYDRIGNILNNTRRNGDGTLNFANTSPDESEREKWTLAM